MLGSAIFFLAGPGLEAGLGPLLLVLVAGHGDWPVAVRVVGGLLIAAGLAVLVPVFASFAREGRGTPSPVAPTQRLIVSGAYRHVRHPMYAATATVIVGEALLASAPVLLVAAAAYVAAMASLSRWVEQPRLAARFGADYAAYRAAVPGWVPRVRPRRAQAPWGGGGSGGNSRSAQSASSSSRR